MKIFSCWRRPAVFLALAVFFTAAPANAQWLADQRLTVDDDTSSLALNNARCIAAGDDGVLHVVWFDNRNGSGAEQVFYKRSADQGATWSAETQLSSGAGREWYPAVCASGASVHVVWFNGTDISVRYRRSTDGGASWLPDTVISVRTAWTSPNGYPSIAASGSEVYAVWGSLYQYLSSQYISFSRSTDGGATWSGDAALTDSTIANNRSESPAVAASGTDVHVGWTDRRDGNNNVYYKRSTDTGATWTPDARLIDPYMAMNPSLAAAGSQVHAVWFDAHDGGEIYYKKSTDRGATWAQEIPLTATPYWVRNPSVSVSGAKVHVFWEEGYGGGPGIALNYRRSVDGGQTWPDAELLTADSSTYTFIQPSGAVRDSFAFVVWQDGRNGNQEIYLKRNPHGNASGMTEKPGTIAKPPVQVLAAAPNPFHSYTAVTGRELEIFTLYDASGRPAGRFAGGRIGEGVPAGVYFLKSGNDSITSVRIVKVR